MMPCSGTLLGAPQQREDDESTKPPVANLAEKQAVSEIPLRPGRSGFFGLPHLPFYREGLEASHRVAATPCPSNASKSVSRKLKPTERRVRVITSLPPMLYAALVKASQREGISVSAYNRRALMQVLQSSPR